MRRINLQLAITVALTITFTVAPSGCFVNFSIFGPADQRITNPPGSRGEPKQKPKHKPKAKAKATKTSNAKLRSSTRHPRNTRQTRKQTKTQITPCNQNPTRQISTTPYTNSKTNSYISTNTTKPRIMFSLTSK